MFLLKGFLNFFSLFFRRPKFWIVTAVVFLTVWVVATVYGERVILDIPVYVVDHDNSTVSRTLRNFLEASPDLHVIGSLDTPEEAKDHIYEGDAVAVIYIPAGLSQAVKTQNGGTVMAYIDGTSMIAAKNVSKAMQTVVKTTSVGVSMIAVQKQGVHDSKLMGMLQPINLDVERPFNALTIYSEYLLPVLVFFCLYIYTCIMTCAVFQETPKKKVTEHVIRRRFYYFGRLVGVFALSFALGMVIYLYCLPRVDIVLHSTPLMAITSLAVFIILTEFLFSIINIALPVAVAMTISYLICMCSVMMAGLTWPLESMPWYIQEIATWLPLTPFLQSVQVFMYNNATWSDLSVFGWMFLKQFVVFLCMAFCIMRIKDIKLFFTWLYRRIKKKRAESIEMQAVAVKEKQEKDGSDTPSTEDGTAVAECQTPSTEDGTAVAECQTPSTEEGTAVAECQTPSTEEKSSFAECQTPSTEEKSSFAECQTPSTEERSSVAECQTPSTEDGTAVAECQKPSTEERSSVDDSGTADCGERTSVIDLGTSNPDESTSDTQEDKP